MANLLVVNTLVFYILAVVFFCGFLVVLLFYLLNQKKNNNKQTKGWTIESAKKFLESQNIDIKAQSNEKVSSEALTTPTVIAEKPTEEKVDNKKEKTKI